MDFDGKVHFTRIQASHPDSVTSRPFVEVTMLTLSDFARFSHKDDSGEPNSLYYSSPYYNPNSFQCSEPAEFSEKDDSCPNTPTSPTIFKLESALSPVSMCQMSSSQYHLQNSLLCDDNSENSDTNSAKA